MEEMETKDSNDVNDDRVQDTLNKIKTLSRDELEEIIINGFIETINSHADIQKLRDKCHQLNSAKDRLVVKSSDLQKQVKDLTEAVRHLTNNSNRNSQKDLKVLPSEPLPIRYFRDVGLQVGPKPSGQPSASDKLKNYKCANNDNKQPIKPKKKVEINAVQQQMKDITNDTAIIPKNINPLVQNSTCTNANLVQNQEISSSKSAFVSAVKVNPQQQQKQLRNPTDKYFSLRTRPIIFSRPSQTCTRPPETTQNVHDNLVQVLLQQQQQQQNLESHQNIVEITGTNNQIINQGQIACGGNSQLQFLSNQIVPQSQQTFNNNIKVSPQISHGNRNLNQVSAFKVGQFGLRQQQILPLQELKFTQLPPFPPSTNILPPRINSSIRRENYLVPPKPELTLEHHGIESGVVVLTWNCTSSREHAEIDVYQIFVCQESISEIPNQTPPTFTQWKSTTKVKALGLPLRSCNIQVTGNKRHHFIVRGIDVYNRAGEFSDPQSIIF